MKSKILRHPFWEGIVVLVSFAVGLIGNPWLALAILPIIILAILRSQQQVRDLNMVERELQEQELRFKRNLEDTANKVLDEAKRDALIKAMMFG